MKLTKTYILALALMLTLGIASVSFAQEDVNLEAVTETEITLSELVSDEVAIELGLDGEVGISNELTLEEAVEIIVDAEEVSDDEVITGDIVITTDEYVVIETEPGEYVKVPVTAKKGGQRKRTGAFIALSATQPGHTLTIVPETSSTTKVTGATFANGNITNASTNQSYKVSSSTKVVVNGEESSQSELNDIDENDQVTVVTDDEGEVIAITVIEGAEVQEGITPAETENEEDKKTPWGWIIAVLAVVGIIVITRRSK